MYEFWFDSAASIAIKQVSKLLPVELQNKDSWYNDAIALSKYYKDKIRNTDKKARKAAWEEFKKAISLLGTRHLVEGETQSIPSARRQ